MKLRINKYISSTGYCSRREADKLITAFRVKVNGVIAELGTKVEENDEVSVDDKIISKNEENKIYILLNKPKGIVCTTEKDVEGNIVDFIGLEERIFPVGRLDKESEGIIILTNDGDIVNKILRSENNHKKEYIVKVNKIVSDRVLKELENGVKIYNPVKNEYTFTKKAKIKRMDEKTFKITITQGLNRQIRRMCTAFDLRVVYLKRVKIDNIRLGELALGEWRYLTEKELKGII